MIIEKIIIFAPKFGLNRLFRYKPKQIMKKVLLLPFVLLATLLAALPANAQGVKFGIKAGFNVSDVDLKGNLMNNVAKDNQTGFFAGATLDVAFPIGGLGADIAVLYDQKKLKTEFDDTETLEYIDIPLNVKYTFGFSSVASAYVATGPQVAFNIGGKSLDYFKDAYESEFQMRNSEFSWNVGAGATVLGHLRIGYNYNIALGRTADFNFKDVQEKYHDGELKHNTHQISLTYLF